MSENKKEFKIVESNKKSKYSKPKKLPANYDQIDKWQMPEINAGIVKGPFLEESSFATLFPKYREKYIKEVFALVQKALRQNGIKAELDLLEGSMTVRTTKKTFDPYAIIKARDIIKLLARSVPYEVCLKLLQDDTYCDVIKIKSLVRNKEKFIKRRKRLIGPSGDTIKALEILTECYILVQGHTVSIIGHYKKMKQTRRIIEGIMTNTHPVFYIKDLMIKRELMKDEQLKDQSWDRFLPKFQNNRKQVQKKKKIKKKNKEKSQFPNPPQPRKIDMQMESGEYFLSEQQKKKHQDKLRNEKKDKKRQERIKQRIQRYEEPEQQQSKLKVNEKKVQNNQNVGDKEIDNLVNKFKIDQNRERNLSGEEPPNNTPENPNPENPNPENPNPENQNPENQNPENKNPEDTDKKDGEGEGEDDEKEKKPKEKSKFKSTFEVNPENIQKVVFKEVASLLLKDSPKDDETAINFANKFIFFTQDGNTWINYQDYKNQNISDTKFRFALKENSNSPTIFEINIDLKPEQKKAPRPEPQAVQNEAEGEGEGEQKTETQTEIVEKEQILIIFSNDYFRKKIYTTKDVFGIKQFYPYFEQQIKDIILYQEQIIYSLDDVKIDILALLTDNFNADSFEAATHTSGDSVLSKIGSGLMGAMGALKNAVVGKGIYGEQDGFKLMTSLKSSSESKKISFSETQKQQDVPLDLDAIQNNSILMDVNLINYEQDTQEAIQFMKQLIESRSFNLAQNLPDDSEIQQKSLMYFMKSTNQAIDDIWLILFMNNDKIYMLIDSDNYTYEKSINFLTKINLVQQIQNQMVYLREIFLRNFSLLQYGDFEPEQNIQNFQFLFENVPQNEFKASRYIPQNTQDFEIEISIQNNISFTKMYPMYSQFQTSLLAIDYFKILNTYLQIVKVDPIYETENHFNNNQIVSFYPLLQPEQTPAFFDNVGRLIFQTNNNVSETFLDLTLLRIQREPTDKTQLSLRKVNYPMQKRVFYSWNKGKKTINEDQHLFKVFNGSRRKKIL